MAGFGDRPDDRLAREMGLGPTGEYPDGKDGPDDQGELRCAVAVDRENRRIRVEFGKPVAWLSFTQDEAVAFTRAIMKHVLKLQGGDGDPDVVPFRVTGDDHGGK